MSKCETAVANGSKWRVEVVGGWKAVVQGTQAAVLIWVQLGYIVNNRGVPCVFSGRSERVAGWSLFSFSRKLNK